LSETVRVYQSLSEAETQGQELSREKDALTDPVYARGFRSTPSTVRGNQKLSGEVEGKGQVKSGPAFPRQSGTVRSDQVKSEAIRDNQKL
jgi:hypothetical protein